jgi:pentatricopeptide repeat protein
MHHRNVISYNTIISAYARDPDKSSQAFSFFLQMATVGVKPNASTLASLVRSSLFIHDSCLGISLHANLMKSGHSKNNVLQTALIGMYGELRWPESANQVFDQMPEKDVVAFNSIISCNIAHGRIKQGLRQFHVLLSEGLVPSQITYTLVISACERIDDLKIGRAIHGKIIMSNIKPDVHLQNALLGMYSTNGDMETALFIFERIEMPDLVSWNSLVAGYSNIGAGDKAMSAVIQLRGQGWLSPDDYTLASVIAATANLPCFYYGKPLHVHVIKTGFEASVHVGNTLINMYFLNNHPSCAQNIFNSVQKKDAIMWTEMVVGHSNLGEGELAMRYFNSMRRESYKVDSFSLSSSLNSVADLIMVRPGEMLHSLVVKSGYEYNVCVCGNLLNMYSKIGDLEASYKIFSKVPDPDLKCWNSMIMACGNNGRAQEACDMFDEMSNRGIQPNSVTYISLLSACSHARLVDKARYYWFSMLNDGIQPCFQHYACMTSLLSRAGLLEEAQDLITKSPFANQFSELWRIILSSCVIFKNLSVGLGAAERVIALDPNDCSTHILLSNFYASVGKWKKVAEMRKRISDLMLEKQPGVSWIEIKDSSCVFSG